MDISEILLRHLDTQGAVYSPVNFDGGWVPDEQAVIQALIVAHDGAAVPATHNTWTVRWGPWLCTAKRATWDSPICADTPAALLERIRDYYDGT